MPDLPPPSPPSTILEGVKSVEKELLEGPRDRRDDLESAVRVFLELLRGYESLEVVPPCVTVFGSARFVDGHPYYELAQALGKRLAEEGFTVMTGGGPGIMEAANRGAKEGGGLSIGVNIVLPNEQAPNAFVDRYVLFDHFYVRKVMLVKYSTAFVVFPGGFGTLDEVFETLTLIQTGKIERFPVVLMGSDFWNGLYEFLGKTLVAAGTIGPGDTALIQLTDSVEEAVSLIKQKMAPSPAPGPAAQGGGQDAVS
jgi:uncharacterized protein (TIGR00730 family)